MRRFYLPLAIVAILTVGMIAGCGSDNGTNATEGNGTGSGTMSVLLSDSPFPFSILASANVKVTKVTGRRESDSDTSFVTLYDGPDTTINLLDLQNGVTATLAETQVPAGSYNQFRFFVDSASVTLTDGSEYALKVPSGSSSGLKLMVDPAVIVVEDSTNNPALGGILLIDVDVSQSFVLQGNPETPAGIHGFNFKPVLRGVNLNSTGSIVGMVSDTGDVALADAQIWAETDTVVANTSTDESGAYTLLGLLPTGYDLYATKDGYDTSSVAGVQVGTGVETPVNFTLTPLN